MSLAVGSSLVGQMQPYFISVFEDVFFFFQENQCLLLADPASDVWKAYVDYVDEIVLDGFFTAIECSLKYLLENTGDCWILSPGHGGYFTLTKGKFLVWALPHA